MSVLAAPRSTSSSQSPSRRTLGDKISALGARLSRTLSNTEENREEEDRYSVDSVPYYKPQEPSTSRGREAFQSTGRGGLGNMRRTSLSRDARPETGPDDFSITRGREPAVNPNQVYSTGRGGAGNLHSPSREPSSVRPLPDVAEQDIIREYVAAHEHTPISSGRGGIGNIRNTSHSRSRSRPPAVHSTGRGGAGNIHLGDGHKPDVIDEEERRRVGATDSGPHSTGRGGLANITPLHEPPIEHSHPTHERRYESTGRGGAGNIHRDRSKSKTRV